jgi:pSer/pThr/pTyr-binding forkhead associated (FHA) protein
MPPLPNLTLIHRSGKEFTITGRLIEPEQKLYLGRHGGQKKPLPEIDLTELPYSERLSRPHAHIFWDVKGNCYMIVDNKSANGTILNNTLLVPWKPYPLTHGAILEFGKEHFIQFTIRID